jgi:hypothetical protein
MPHFSFPVLQCDALVVLRTITPMAKALPLLLMPPQPSLSVSLPMLSFQHLTRFLCLPTHIPTHFITALPNLLVVALGPF